MFGEQRVLQELAGTGTIDLQQMVDALVSSATEFAGGHLADDLAVIAVRPERGLAKPLPPI